MCSFLLHDYETGFWKETLFTHYNDTTKSPNPGLKGKKVCESISQLEWYTVNANYIVSSSWRKMTKMSWKKETWVREELYQCILHWNISNTSELKRVNFLCCTVRNNSPPRDVSYVYVKERRPHRLRSTASVFLWIGEDPLPPSPFDNLSTGILRGEWTRVRERAVSSSLSPKETLSLPFSLFQSFGVM